MRRVIPILAALSLSAPGCPGPAEPHRPTASPRPLTAPPGARPRPRPPVRKGPRPRPRPKGFRAQLLGRVSAGTGRVTGLVASGATLVSATRGSKGTWLKGWDPSTRKVKWTLKAPARQVELGLSADGKSLLATTPGGTNYIYQLTSGAPKMYRKWKRKRGRNKGRTQGLSADGAMLIRGDVRGQVRGYALDKYKMKWLVKGERVLLSTDGKVAVVLRGSELKAVHAVTGRPLAVPSTFDSPPLALAAHSRGRVAAVFAKERTKMVCGLGGLGTPRSIPCLKHLQLIWSPGGTLLALAGLGEAQLIPRARGRKTISIKSASKGVLRAAFPSDTTFVLANERPGQLSFYRLVRR